MLKPKWPARSFRRILLDMHIPDSDPEFLSRFDAKANIDAVRQAGADSVMVYFQSHTGLCNWPTNSGVQHSAFQGRDPVAETLDYASKKNLPVCAYYSINFNNQASMDHPDWRFRPATVGKVGGGLLVRERYGICCLNNQDYRQFIETQIAEILKRYSFDALFFDMVWWMGVCLCSHCHARYCKEELANIPGTIDWLDPDWCRFQSARERWLKEFAHWLRGLVKQHCTEISVYHNFAPGMMNWTRGVSFELAQANDFLGGDFYGGRDEQLVISRLMLNLSERHPVEFMTTVTTDLAEHETLKSSALLSQQSLAAAASGSAILLIAGIDPDGKLNPAIANHLRHALQAREPFDQQLGGDAVEQIGIYFSDQSKMTFAENGELLSAMQEREPLEYPHFAALRGACRKLQQAHLPFGIISAKQLTTLHEYDVVVLPNLLRITEAETSAFRDYVKNGGRLYASRLTSLTGVDGVRHDDFMLSDLFGCHFGSIEAGRMLYLKPEDALISNACAPQRFLRQRLDLNEMIGAVRLASADPKASILASLNIPFGHPSFGSVDGLDWASIHSSPPWTQTEIPVIVRNNYGDGRVIYSAADLEADDGDAHSSVFLGLIKDLLPQRPLFEADAHQAIWLTVFQQSAKQRFVISFLNNTSELPAELGAAVFRMKPPAGTHFTSLAKLPDNQPVEFASNENGDLVASLKWRGLFAMYAVNYEEARE